MNHLNVINDGTNTHISLDRDGTAGTFTSVRADARSNVASDRPRPCWSTINLLFNPWLNKGGVL
jgi:hypothetical protein